MAHLERTATKPQVRRDKILVLLRASSFRALFHGFELLNSFWVTALAIYNLAFLASAAIIKGASFSLIFARSASSKDRASP
ncbi:hypothetical protein EC912_101217 [Luteibacter rhizovicinus]|uniref:Uncharacterized protein n=1 Tax=Luteibacter rhizovicinus TaxID=242606 RepID=A0A4R3YXF3_9GAMM|nr:hypothetical protein EC912_101217 [Luteibacter rhizovicinus]